MIKKGTIIDEMYLFVVVEEYEGSLHMLDTHANNIWSFELDRMQDPQIIDPKELSDGRYYKKDCPQNYYEQIMVVVGEVLSGQHDNRFDHWKIATTPLTVHNLKATMEGDE